MSSKGKKIVQFEEVKKKRLAEQEAEYERYYEGEWDDEEYEPEPEEDDVLWGIADHPFIDYFLPPDGVLGMSYVDVPGFSEPYSRKFAYIEMRHSRKRAQQVMNPWYWKKKYGMVPTTICFTRTWDGKRKRIVAIFGLGISVVDGKAGRLIVSDDYSE